MIDGSEERKRQLAFELQNSRAFEKRSKGEFGKTKGWRNWNFNYFKTFSVLF